MTTAVEIVVIIAALILGLALISMLRLWIPKAQVWKEIRWGFYVQRIPMDEYEDWPDPSEAPTQTFGLHKPTD